MSVHQPTVARERRERIGIIRLDREEKRNAINEAVTTGIDAALNELEDDDGLWVGVITGAPTVFSAGTDLGESSGAPTRRGGEYGVIRRRRRKPLIAAVEGAALGGGFEIVLACDLVVAASTATFGLPEARRGVIASCGGLFRTHRALPLNVAKEMLVTGEPITASRAHALGLVNALTPPGSALDEALVLAERICANAPVPVRESLRALNDVLEAGDADAWRASEEAVATVVASDDIGEGLAAFFERREPQWSGR